MKKDNLNPNLMIGDEVTVVHVDKSYGTMHTPERFKNYVVTGIKYRQPENWEGPDADTKYYEITPIGETQEQRADSPGDNIMGFYLKDHLLTHLSTHLCYLLDYQHFVLVLVLVGTLVLLIYPLDFH